MLTEQELRQELRKVFADTLDEGFSFAGILVTYRGIAGVETAIGIPYSISVGNLELGPYVKNEHAPPPYDYFNRMMSIHLSKIIRYKRIELSDLIKK